MAIPLDRLLEDNRNVYQVTSAIVRRAHQIGEIRRAFSSDEHGSVNEEGDKVVSQAIAEIINEDVRFELTE
ncbi:MAG: DNA-directed RNA polymerase subunit omega [Spirochaeta sp.]|jgi:DNA-directed RNA polymerase subunit K/omega|nr:DNA-directed RNA polymerase subunit omega [Spirochaeta sp.]